MGCQEPNVDMIDPLLIANEPIEQTLGRCNRARGADERKQRTEQKAKKIRGWRPIHDAIIALS